MKLNDPFGRMERRHQLGYETMRDAMRRSGIDTPEAAREIIKQARQRALKFIGITLAVLVPISLFFPQFLLLTGALAVLLIAWTASSTMNGQRYINRYIKEDLKQ